MKKITHNSTVSLARSAVNSCFTRNPEARGSPMTKLAPGGIEGAMWRRQRATRASRPPLAMRNPTDSGSQR